MTRLKKCGECNQYTLEETCPVCGAATRDPAPPAFSFPDRHGEYRRKTRKGDHG